MTVDEIQAKVTAQKTVLDGCVTLLNSLSAEIRANANNPQKLQQLADSIDANTQEIAEGVTANTPQSQP